MEMQDKNATTQLFESTAKNDAAAGVGTFDVTFQAILEQFEATGETRIIAHQRDGIAELGVMEWAMQALEMDSYLTAKKRLMDKEGLTSGGLNLMTAAERAVFEARVFDHVKHEARSLAGDQIVKEKRRLYRVMPLPVPN